MKFERSSGVILHPTSLPGPYGTGDIGPAAHRWVDFLAQSGTGLWQVLPLGPTGYGDSPYQCFSAFAGNPYLVSPEVLQADGLLTEEDLAGHPPFPEDRVDFGWVIPWKLDLLDRAYAKFQASASQEQRRELTRFRMDQTTWLEDFALFMTLKDVHGGAPWPTWEPALRDRDVDAIQQARQDMEESVERQIFRQFLFFRQWSALRSHAQAQGLRIIGDAPIFVAHDSADVWAHPELFYLEPDGQPTVVAGVPPDYFSPTGQLWGNPLYRWPVHADTGYSWWIARLRAVLQTVDIIRLDHFRGFAGYWEVPAGLPTAEKGRWVPGPGIEFFNAVRAALGDLPLIAEDLGEITPDVFELRDRFELPGMKILQFAFLTTPDEKFLPHHYPTNCVVYTGTHDNDTTLGWFQSAPEIEKDFCRRYLGRADSDIVWGMIRAIWSSVAMFALAPMQDLLGLGTEARMNYPGRPSGNWTWRVPAYAMNKSLAARMESFNFLYSRKQPKEKETAAVEEISPAATA